MHYLLKLWLLLNAFQQRVITPAFNRRLSMTCLLLCTEYIDSAIARLLFIHTLLGLLCLNSVHMLDSILIIDALLLT